MRASHSTLQFFITGLQGCGKVSLLPYWTIKRWSELCLKSKIWCRS
jgi:hypothetical protein